MESKLAFKAINKDTGEVFDVKEIEFDLSVVHAYNGEYMDFSDVEIMQFTGYHDRNGSEIYTGHILYFGNPEWAENHFAKGYYVVKYDDDGDLIAEREEPTYNYLLPNVWKKCVIDGVKYE